MKRTALLLATMAAALGEWGGLHARPPAAEDGSLVTECADVGRVSYPAADLVGAGSRLHVRIFKTRRPE